MSAAFGSRRPTVGSGAISLPSHPQAASPTFEGAFGAELPKHERQAGLIGVVFFGRTYSSADFGEAFGGEAPGPFNIRMSFKDEAILRFAVTETGREFILRIDPEAERLSAALCGFLYADGLRSWPLRHRGVPLFDVLLGAGATHAHKDVTTGVGAWDCVG